METAQQSDMKQIHLNSLFLKLALSVLTGMAVLAASLSWLTIRTSGQIFSEMFSASQRKIFGQIEERFYQMYMNLAEIANTVADDAAVQAYLTAEQLDGVKGQKLTWQMQSQIRRTSIRQRPNLTLFLAGADDRSYLCSQGDVVRVPYAELLEYPVTQKAREQPGWLVCNYMQSGFTDTMKNVPVIAACRTITDGRGHTAGYLWLLMKESEVRAFYNCFLTGISDIVVFNQEGEVISTNNPRYRKDQNEELSRLLEVVAQARKSRVYATEEVRNGETVCYLVQQFTNSDFVIAGVVNARQTFYEAYGLYRNILITILVACSMMVPVFILVRRQTRPVSRLAASMREQKQRRFTGSVPVEGTDEIRELSKTYNEMITDLNLYIRKVVETEEAKRTAELHALQMQIHPHFIYNTLAGIKWLILQRDTKQSLAVLDAFIALLRNTISNADAFITIRQEEQNLRNYIQIIQTRYGSKIQAGFYIQPECMEAKIPKLTLQPLLENAFFHAFPNGQRGTVNILIHHTGKQLRIEIEDDGIGIKKDSTCDPSIHKETPGTSKEHFTGIGIRNVDERLKILYGPAYGITIDSKPGRGTTVKVQIPYELYNQNERRTFKGRF